MASIKKHTTAGGQNRCDVRWRVHGRARASVPWPERGAPPLLAEVSVLP